MSKGKKAASGKRVTALACTALVFAAAFFPKLCSFTADT